MSLSLPGEVEGGLAVVHDGGDAVVVIGGHTLAAGGFLTRSPQVSEFLPEAILLACQFLYPALVGVVLLAQCRCFLHGGIGYPAYQRPVLGIQDVYLRLKLRYTVVVFRFQAVKLRQVEAVVRQRGLHGALLGMGIK